MDKPVPHTVTSPDGRQKAEFDVRADGTCRYSVIQWYDNDPDNPYERPPGWWSPIWQSGIFASLEDATRDLAVQGWPVVKYTA